MEMSAVPVRCTDVVEAEVDGQRVVMSPHDYAYFGLAGTGAQVWDRLDGVASVGEIVDALAGEFGADAAQVRGDVVEFVDALQAAGLLVTV
jgi:hypothetical protein